MRCYIICIISATFTFSQSDAAQWQIIAHLDSRGGLTEVTEKYVNQLTRVRRNVAGLALQVVTGAPGQDQISVRRWLVDEKKQITHQYQAWVEADKDQDAGVSALSSFLPWAKEKLNKSPIVLIYLGHGAGLINEKNDSSSRIKELRDILSKEVARSGSPFTLLNLDTCFGSTIETAYELQGIASYVTATPGLMYSPGIDWTNILRTVQAENGDPRTLSEIIIKSGMSRANIVKSELIALNLEPVDKLTQQIKTLTVRLIDNLREEAPVLRVIRSRCQNWGYRNELCDLGQLLTGISINSTNNDVRNTAFDCIKTLKTVVIFSNNQVKSETKNDVSGLGIYFPASIQVISDNSLPSLRFNMSTDWNRFLEEFWRVSQDQLFPFNQ